MKLTASIGEASGDGDGGGCAVDAVVGVPLIFAVDNLHPLYWR